MRKWLRIQSGQGMVEYALILVLVALIIVFMMFTLGQQDKNLFSNIEVVISSHL